MAFSQNMHPEGDPKATQKSRASGFIQPIPLILKTSALLLGSFHILMENKTRTNKISDDEMADQTRGASMRVIACPLIRNHEGEYLLCKMPSHRGVFPGKWGLSGGGIEQNEDMYEALRREIREELGDELIISEASPWKFRDDRREKLFPDGQRRMVYMIYLIFDCLAENKIIKLNSEFEEYAWVKPSDLNKYDLNEATRLTFQQKGLLGETTEKMLTHFLAKSAKE